MTTRLLLIECADRKGLVTGITGALFRRDCNIVHNAEFADTETGRFFMRTEFEGALEDEDLVGELKGVLPQGASIRLSDNRKKRIVILVTREPHCIGDLLIRCAYDDLPAEIAGVIGNHPVLEPLVQRFDLPFHVISHENRSREDHETEVAARIDPLAPDVIVLAKYMRIFSPSFIQRYPNRIVNIHHSFLPAFVGAQPYRQAYDRGVKITGATAHFVTEDLDEGPIIAQGVLPVDHTHGPKEMARAGRDVEKTILARALRLVLEERVFVTGNRTVTFD